MDGRLDIAPENCTLVCVTYSLKIGTHVGGRTSDLNFFWISNSYPITFQHQTIKSGWMTSTTWKRWTTLVTRCIETYAPLFLAWLFHKFNHFHVVCHIEPLSKLLPDVFDHCYFQSSKSSGLETSVFAETLPQLDDIVTEVATKYIIFSCQNNPVQWFTPLSWSPRTFCLLKVACEFSCQKFTAIHSLFGVLFPDHAGRYSTHMLQCYLKQRIYLSIYSARIARFKYQLVIPSCCTQVTMNNSMSDAD